jgi:hypothetical protein
MADQCHGFDTQHVLLRNEVSYNVVVSGVTTDESCRSSTIRGSIAALWRVPIGRVARRLVRRHGDACELTS